MEILLETQRLRLREFAPQDLDDLHRLNRDPEVMRFVGPGTTQTRAQAEASLKRVVRLYREHPGYGVWAAVEKASNCLVGAVLLVPYPETNEVEVGYRFFKEEWGRGYATESTKALIHYGFETLGLTRIIAIAYPENSASIRVMQKCGMRDEGVIHNQQLDLDAVYYAIEKDALQ